jgi:hypothetical protein
VFGAPEVPPTPPPLPKHAPAAPTCVGDAPRFESRVAGDTLLLCFHYNDRVACWSFGLATNTWLPRECHARANAAQLAPVRVSNKRVTACKPDMSDCRTIPLGFEPAADTPITATTNADRSLVAIIDATAWIRILDATGKQLTTIKPWPTPMSGGGKGPALFRSASFVGGTLAVYIADTPVTSAIRLFNPKTGKKIGDVNRGQPMSDSTPAVDLGKNQFAFVVFDTSAIVVHDVTTGKLVKDYNVGKAVEPGGYGFLAASPDGKSLLGVYGLTVVRIDLASSEVTRFHAPKSP